ncbi:MAG: hypothetical protein OXB92_05710 [Acidimicrobiaceae bacterium]|nr:hypothetical protein [Acidimicrobiaceae bacterium]
MTTVASSRGDGTPIERPATTSVVTDWRGTRVVVPSRVKIPTPLEAALSVFDLFGTHQTVTPLDWDSGSSQAAAADSWQRVGETLHVALGKFDRPAPEDV